MKVLFATSNQAKVKRYQKSLEKYDIELLTIKDLDFNLEIDENGKDALENAYIKAEAYSKRVDMPVIGMDNTLFIEELSADEQPGTHVRRINGKILNDEEMIEHYTNLVKEHGGKLTVKWVYGMVLINKGEKYSYTWSKDHFYFIDKPCELRNPGYPLDSISIIPEYNKYLVELTEDEKSNYKKNEKIDNVVQFIVNSVNK